MRPTQAECQNGFHSGSPLHVMQRKGTRITLAASMLAKDCFKVEKPEPRLDLGTAQLQQVDTDACEGFAGMQD